MHPLFEKASGLTEDIIGAAIEVHKDKGPGLLESVYEWCLTKELELRRQEVVSQRSVVVDYKGFTREDVLKFDILVAGCLLVEVKAAERVLADTQGTTSQLHEVAGYSSRTPDQFP